MIELTDDMRLAVQQHPDEPLRLVDPGTRETFVLLRAEEYERLKDTDYDASPWTDEEMDRLAAEDADSLGWEGMEVYQDEDE
jgi:PHD/YefM family antitoxin component YafN of YafNO toxin-antitoxin module